MIVFGIHDRKIGHLFLQLDTTNFNARMTEGQNQRNDPATCSQVDNSPLHLRPHIIGKYHGINRKPVAAAGLFNPDSSVKKCVCG